MDEDVGETPGGDGQVMTVVCAATEMLMLRHPPPEKLSGAVLTATGCFGRSPRYITLNNTVLVFKRMKRDDEGRTYNLLTCTCRKGNKPGQILLLKSSGQKLRSFSFKNVDESEMWLSQLQYACSWHLEAHYELGAEIGQGGFGQIRRAKSRRSPQEEFAVKIIDYHSERDWSMIQKEVQLLPSINHPHIIKIHDIFEDEDQRRISIAMDYLKAGDMLEYVKNHGPLSEDGARNVMRQVLEALIYLHSKAIAHRDIKPENILIRGGWGNNLDVVLTDFDFADYVPEESHRASYTYGDFSPEECFTGGTKGYIAPEIVYEGVHTTAVDLWSSGVVLYIFLSGKQPFIGHTAQGILTSSLHNNLSFGHEFRGVSDEAVKLVKSMLNVLPAKRLNAGAALLHRWFRPDSHEIERPDRSARTMLRKGFIAALFLASLETVAVTTRNGQSPLELAVRNTAAAE